MKISTFHHATLRLFAVLLIFDIEVFKFNDINLYSKIYNKFNSIDSLSTSKSTVKFYYY